MYTRTGITSNLYSSTQAKVFLDIKFHSNRILRLPYVWFMPAKKCRTAMWKGLYTVHGRRPSEQNEQMWLFGSNIAQEVWEEEEEGRDRAKKMLMVAVLCCSLEKGLSFFCSTEHPLTPLARRDLERAFSYFLPTFIEMQKNVFFKKRCYHKHVHEKPTCYIYCLYNFVLLVLHAMNV